MKVRTVVMAPATMRVVKGLERAAAMAPSSAPPFDRVHVDLPAAARWVLDELHIEPQHGFGQVKQRDNYTCRNPECGCRNLRVQAHHVRFRILRGYDSLENGTTVCRPCHLRLIHTGIVPMTRSSDALVWCYTGRVVVSP